MRYKDFFIEVKTYPLRDSGEWTTHFAVHRDKRDGMELVTNTHMGNRCTSEEEARQTGIREAVRIADLK